ncbi:MAG: hypothetical protein HAW66_10740 [Shewanella sp.]|nr:hypothetical protein [Shewanella sp.]
MATSPASVTVEVKYGNVNFQTEQVFQGLHRQVKEGQEVIFKNIYVLFKYDMNGDDDNKFMKNLMEADLPQNDRIKIYSEFCKSPERKLALEARWLASEAREVKKEWNTKVLCGSLMVTYLLARSLIHLYL